MKKIVMAIARHAICLWLSFMLIVVVITEVVYSQPDIITDPISHPPEFATHTPYPTGTAYIPNPTFIPFVPAPTLTRPDYHATMTANSRPSDASQTHP